MPDWRQEYLAGLNEAEQQQHPLNNELIAACQCHAPADITSHPTSHGHFVANIGRASKS